MCQGTGMVSCGTWPGIGLSQDDPQGLLPEQCSAHSHLQGMLRNGQKVPAHRSLGTGVRTKS